MFFNYNLFALNELVEKNYTNLVDFNLVHRVGGIL